MVLILLVLLPLAVGLWLLVSGRTLGTPLVRQVGVATAGVTFVLAVVASLTRASFDRPWLPDLGMRWHFGLDGISIPLVLLTATIGVLVTLHTWNDIPAGGSPSTFVGSLLITVAGALATFTARDAILFFISFEIVLVPIWILITRFGDTHVPGARAEAGARFILYTAVGSTLMLLGILLLVTSTGTADLTVLAERAGYGLSTGKQLTIAILLSVGLGVKVPLFPVHTWLPPAHTTAPTAGSVLLAAVLLKMGTYGLVRLPLSTVPDGFAKLSPWLALAGVIGIVWGGLICLVEPDLKRLIAYSSIAHMGFVALGLASGTQVGLQAALFANIAHGVVSAMLFFLVGGLKHQWGSVDLGQPRPALRETAPKLGFLFILGLAGSLGLPGLAGFWGEFLAIFSAWSPGAGHNVTAFRIFAVFAAIGAALAAAYALRVARTVWVGDAVAPGTAGAAADTVGAERAVLIVLGVAVVALGVLPGAVLTVTADDVARLLGKGM